MCLSTLLPLFLLEVAFGLMGHVWGFIIVRGAVAKIHISLSMMGLNERRIDGFRRLTLKRSRFKRAVRCRWSGISMAGEMHVSQTLRWQFRLLMAIHPLVDVALKLEYLRHDEKCTKRSYSEAPVFPGLRSHEFIQLSAHPHP